MNSAFCGGIISETTTEKNLPWNRKKFPSNSFLYITVKELSLASLTLCIYYLRTPSCYNQLPTVQMYAMKLIRRLLGQPSQTQPFGRTGENRKMGKKESKCTFLCVWLHTNSKAYFYELLRLAFFHWKPSCYFIDCYKIDQQPFKKRKKKRNMKYSCEVKSITNPYYKTFLLCGQFISTLSNYIQISS